VEGRKGTVGLKVLPRLGGNGENLYTEKGGGRKEIVSAATNENGGSNSFGFGEKRCRVGKRVWFNGKKERK